MLESYRATPSHWRAICARRSVPNLESRYAVRPYLTDGMLEQVSPDGKIKTASLDEEAYSFKADQFAKLFSVTRVSIINDAIGSVFALQGDLGRNAAPDAQRELLGDDPRGGGSRLLLGGERQPSDGRGFPRSPSAGSAWRWRPCGR